MVVACACCERSVGRVCFSWRTAVREDGLTKVFAGRAEMWACSDRRTNRYAWRISKCGWTRLNIFDVEAREQVCLVNTEVNSLYASRTLLCCDGLEWREYVGRDSRSRSPSWFHEPTEECWWGRDLGRERPVRRRDVWECGWAWWLLMLRSPEMYFLSDHPVRLSVDGRRASERSWRCRRH